LAGGLFWSVPLRSKASFILEDMIPLNVHFCNIV
jgi:hypothetical protein